ncbi:aliphatic sulfonate ABC transporter substrate-binding protein [Siculibacillus lacustris]|uniref:Putative aliphatic sulfonates-binding protein n=1 Tax=Siculibacillus lacustris TaxID=1549641 RepID=A0A4Q9VJL7_9HYPH|nr:NrtA/SsuA/CpmA family ABC transporter substrate-binding protein [Siculibacillus lacustris]TBW35535.1 aliphatic sulfonate ABC transporter substrate-binding protein [Siculibacillus lacustris]
MSDHVSRGPTRRSIVGAAAGGFAALLASGRPSRAAPPTGRTTDTVRLSWLNTLLSGIAKERGDLEKRLLASDGLKVEWVGPFPNHAPSIQAVAGGSADFSFGGSTAVGFAAILGGSPLVFALFGDSLPRSTAIIVRPDSPIRSVKDLVGKSIAANRSGLGEYVLVAALEQHGIARDQVDIVYLNPPDAGPAFASGKVDAWSIWSPVVDIARESYKARDVFTEKDLNHQLDYSSFLVPRAFAEKNPDIIRAVAKAYRDEAAWVNANNREVEYLLQSRVNYSDAIRDKYIQEKREFVIYDVNDRAHLARLQASADWFTAHRVLPDKLTVTDHLAKI